MPLEGRGLGIFIVSIVMLSISTVTVAMRSFVRVTILRAFGWDDSLMVAAWAIFVGLSITCIYGPLYGVGHTKADFTDPKIYEKALMLWWLGQILYTWASAIAKISIALALLRLAVERSHRVILWGIIGVAIAIGLMFWFVMLFACSPISYFWERANPTSVGTCIPITTMVNIGYFYSTVTIVCDLSLGVLPIFPIWKLQMNRRTKIAVGGILGLGAIASVAVICRIPYLRFYADDNFLYSTYQIAIWSEIEIGLGITAGSLVTLRPLFRWLLDEATEYYKGSRPGTSKRYQPYGRSDLLDESQTTKYWRPDIELDDYNSTVITASPRGKDLSRTGSQEALNPERGPGDSRNQVTIQKTFVQTFSERQTDI
ncbi:hypothetical protein N7535_001613 [Penicillium sp. DV-2018c]|nr:hypothetical protein N7535_001613 [Penicillium sp. DV-2018c]